MRAPLALLLILLPGAVLADETRYASDSYWTHRRDPERVSHRPYKPKPKRHHHHAYKPAPPSSPPAPIVPHYHLSLCLAEVRAMGTPHVSENAAMDSAKRHWQAVVRYDHGEQYMSVDTARHVKYRCARAETNETAAGRIAEAVSGEAWRMRCEVVAHPCRSDLKEAQ